jgi:hypothetical protein
MVLVLDWRRGFRSVDLIVETPSGCRLWRLNRVCRSPAARGRVVVRRTRAGGPIAARLRRMEPGDYVVRVARYDAPHRILRTGARLSVYLPGGAVRTFALGAQGLIGETAPDGLFRAGGRRLDHWLPTVVRYAPVGPSTGTGLEFCHAAAQPLCLDWLAARRVRPSADVAVLSGVVSALPSRPPPHPTLSPHPKYLRAPINRRYRHAEFAAFAAATATAISHTQIAAAAAQVLDMTNGLPLPRARVELVYAGAPVKHARAGGGGHYLLTAVPAPYEVWSEGWAE